MGLSPPYGGGTEAVQIRVYPRAYGGTLRTSPGRRVCASERVYPRAYGGTHGSGRLQPGLSPRVRGNLTTIRERSIPARTGEMPGTWGLSPRVRGNRIHGVAAAGLSPRVRGNLCPVHSKQRVYPRAYGGTPSRKPQWVYPRAYAGELNGGLSPRVRGNLDLRLPPAPRG